MAEPAAPVRVCRLDDLADPGSRGWPAGDRPRLFVVRKQGRLFAYRDICPHRGAPLAWSEHRYLTREGDLILCSLHAALFRIEDGVCVDGPCEGDRLAPLPVTIRDGWVEVG